MDKNYTKQDHYISNHRLAKYIHACGGDRSKALRLYEANLSLSESLYTILSHFEISFRNALNERLSNHFTDPDWILNQTVGYMSNRRLNPKYMQKTKVNNTITNFRRNGIHTPTSGMIIASQTMGFWTECFERKHYASIGGAGALLPIFTNLPIGTNRSAIYDRLTQVRLLRNRIAHHEPICFAPRSNNFDLTRTKETYDKLYDLIDWIDLDLKKWINRNDDVLLKIDMLNLCKKNKNAFFHFLYSKSIIVKHRVFKN